MQLLLRVQKQSRRLSARFVIHPQQNICLKKEVLNERAANNVVFALVK